MTPRNTANIRLGIREFGVIAIVLIMVLSYSSFFYFREETREQVKLQLIEEQKERQLESTDEIADHIGSDLTLISSILNGISNSEYLQAGEFYDDGLRQLISEEYSQVSDVVDNLFILNDEDIVVLGASNSSGNTLAPVGNDFSFRPWVRETRTTLQPIFSEAFEAVGEYRVFITNPVIDRDTGQYLGLVGASVPTVDFFKHYGNVHDINSQFLVAYDKKGVLLAVGASQTLVGMEFFGNVVQDFVNHNPTLGSHVAKMLEGESGYAMYDYGAGERLTTYRTVFVAKEPTYFIQVVTPTDTIYSQIDPILFRESEKLTLFLAGSTAASAILIVFLLFWNSSLRKEVVRRTIDLEESNRRLAAINEQLKRQDKIQREFINIAAHEMRTPIQPIIGMSGMILEKVQKMQKKRSQIDASSTEQVASVFVTYPNANSAFSAVTQIVDMLNVVIRNAKRLDKLSNSLLDVSRIENKSLKLNKEKMDLNEKIANAILDTSAIIGITNDTKIIFQPSSEPITVEADRPRLFQVISNLIYNAIKFTQRGTITVKCEKQGGYAQVSVKDDGSGIDPEIIPQLFTKFATKSQNGMGLGLYLSKNIVEAHGGKIWAQNNVDGKGATFTFTLPLADPSRPDGA